MFSKKAVLALASLLAANSVAQAEEFWQRPFYYERDFEDAPSALASSVVPQEKMGTIVRLDFLSSAEVPALFRQFLPGENFDRPRDVSIYLALTNDYNVLRPVGVKELPTQMSPLEKATGELDLELNKVTAILLTT